MNSREIIKCNLSSGDPGRFGMSFGKNRLHDFISAGPGPSRKWKQSRRVEGNTEYYDDEWGNTWHRLVDGCARGEIFEPVIKDWNQLKDLPLPDLDDPTRYVPVKATFAAEHAKYRLGSLPGFPFAISRYMRKMEIYFQDLILEREHVDELHAKVTGVLERMIAQYGAAGADGIFFCEDWGIQDRLLISPNMWREIFKPLFQRLCGAAHRAGLDVLMHSCGYNRAILDDLAEAGVNAFQFDQPELYGLERLADKLSEIRVCLWSPVDIQKVMPTGNREKIEHSATRMVELFSRRNGRFIATHYGDLKGIGVQEEWDKWAYDTFVALNKRT